MRQTDPKIDISENTLRNRGRILDILLCDKTVGKNILWATDSYATRGKDYAPKMQILRAQITGHNGKLIQPRAAKPKEEQIARTKGNAEVFTPLSFVKQMNITINWASKNWPTTEDNWIDYIKELRLEITCGEAPFIAGRYDPSDDKNVVQDTKKRVGFLDYKLKTVNEFVNTKKDWLAYAEIALKATYGYEWQGDNLLIARENVLQTMDDFYEAFCLSKFGKKNKLSTVQLERFAEIVAWNIFQMDGLKYVVPMSCHHESKITPGELTLFGETPDTVEEYECEGCKFNRPTKHNGKYVKIMDWAKKKPIRFVELTAQIKRRSG